MLISLVLGGFVGAVLGLTGAGGGILAVPALVVGMSWPMQQATPVALVAVAGSAALGALEGFRRGRYRAALLMAVAGVPLTTLGVRLAHVLPQRLLLALFALTMLVVAGRLLRQALRHAPVDAEASPLRRPRESRYGPARVVPVGVALASTGAMTA